MIASLRPTRRRWGGQTPGEMDRAFMPRCNYREAMSRGVAP